MTDLAGTQQITATPDNVNNNNSAPAEKMLSQTEVNALIGRVKHEERQKAYQDAVSDMQKTPASGQAPVNGNAAQSTQDIGKLVEDTVSKRLQEQQVLAQKQLYNQHAEKIAGEINAKLAEGKSRYNDFDSVVKQDALAESPDIALLANGVDNTPDVLYDLMKNPSKLATVNSLLMMAKMNNSRYYYDLAQSEMRKLSDSIKTNQAAVQNAPQTKEPLSQLKPSVTGSDNGARSVGDFRKMFKA